MAERLRKHFASRKVLFDEMEIPVTFSAGVASLPLEEDIKLDQLIERADKALCLTKKKRDRMAYWDIHECRPYIIV